MAGDCYRIGSVIPRRTDIEDAHARKLPRGKSGDREVKSRLTQRKAAGDLV
jgi:hypothetical protein